MSKSAVVMKAGKGTTLQVLGTSVRFLCEAAHTDRAFSVMEVVLPRDQGPPPHEHPWDEAYLVLAGEVRFQLEEQSDVYQTGDFLYAPGGMVHAFQGASAEAARVLVIDAPATSEQFFRDVDREVRVYPEDVAKLPEIGARHELRFLAPA